MDFYNRDQIYSILDEEHICHLGFVANGQSLVIPRAYGCSGIPWHRLRSNIWNYPNFTNPSKTVGSGFCLTSTPDSFNPYFGNGGTIYDSAGIVNGIVVAIMPEGTVKKTIFTDVFVYGDGKWRAVSAQELPLEPTTSPVVPAMEHRVRPPSLRTV